VFATERSGPFTGNAAERLARIGDCVSFDMVVYARTLRHRCDYALENKDYNTRAIENWLGHRSIDYSISFLSK
jgi:type 1 fimbriae regulatory protein FimB/type 1 fimbriae regulatory protein FimE